MTVDQVKRRSGADLLQQFIAGEITNDQLHQGFPSSESDIALRAIFISVWMTYSDLREHRLTGTDAPNDEALAVLERCRLFLKSDLSFEWPSPKISLVSGTLNLLSFGFIARRNEKQMRQYGDFDYWPFMRKADYMAALERDNRG